MTSISAVGSPGIEMWMVNLLFGGNASQEGSHVAAKPTPIPSVIVSSSAKDSVSAATAWAITTLQGNGGDATPDSATSERQSMSATQANAVVASVDAMTSDQISAALYSGAGLPAVGDIGGPNATFSELVNRMLSDAAWKQNPIQTITGQNFGTAAVGDASLAAEGAHDATLAASMQKAFDNHTLVFQKASDVEGLNYHEVTTFKSYDPSKPPNEVDNSALYDKTALSNLLGTDRNGNTHVLATIGTVTMILSWQDQNLSQPTKERG